MIGARGNIAEFVLAVVFRQSAAIETHDDDADSVHRCAGIFQRDRAPELSSRLSDSLKCG